MSETGKQVKEQLDFYNVDIDFDPEKGLYRTWFGLPVKVEFYDRGAPFSFSCAIRRKIKIRTKCGDRPKYTSEMAEDLVHEATEADLSVWRIPYFYFALTRVLFGNGSPLEDVAILGGVYLIGEKAVDAISKIRLRRRPEY